MKKAFVLRCISLALALSLLLCVQLFCVGELNSYVSAATVPVNKTVIIDAGHGGEDVGAVARDNIFEKDLNLSVAMLIAEGLRQGGFTVVMTRETDRLLYTEAENIKGMRKIYDLKNRVKIANSYENAVFISIHMNSFSDGRYSGFTTYSGLAEGSARLASAIQSSVVNRLQPSNKRPIKPANGLYLLENSSNPAVLLECGFLTNEKELSELLKKEYQKQLSFAIIYGIIDYIENE